MPEITNSISGQSALTASFTQSTGVPSIAHAFSAPSTARSRAVSGWNNVMLWLAAERWLSGAAT